MDALTDAWKAVADAITTAGVPATVNPGQVLAAIASNPAGVCALLLPPEQEGFAVVGGRGYGMTIPVVLMTHGPDDHDAVGRLHTALLSAITAAPHDADGIRREPWDHGDGPSLPAQRWTTERRVQL